MNPGTPLTILKIGGSVITDRLQERPVPLPRRMERIAAEVADAFRPGAFRLVIVHGAGSFGHPIVKRTGIDRGLSRPEHLLALGETQRLQNWLNAFFVRRLLSAGLPAFPCQASSTSVMDAGRLVSLDLRAVGGLLERGMVPVLYGVPSFDASRGCSILSGDLIAIRLYETFGASSVLHGTDVRGVFAADPGLDPAAPFLPVVDLRGQDDLPPGIGGSTAVDVTGGLRNKLEKLRSAGAGGQIFDATVPGNVRRALAGETVGTRVLCERADRT